jgi:hypothetical protein
LHGYTFRVIYNHQAKSAPSSIWWAPLSEHIKMQRECSCAKRAVDCTGRSGIGLLKEP